MPIIPKPIVGIMVEFKKVGNEMLIFKAHLQGYHTLTIMIKIDFEYSELPRLISVPL